MSKQIAENLLEPNWDEITRKPPARPTNDTLFTENEINQIEQWRVNRDRFVNAHMGVDYGSPRGDRTVRTIHINAGGMENFRFVGMEEVEGGTS